MTDLFVVGGRVRVNRFSTPYFFLPPHPQYTHTNHVYLSLSLLHISKISHFFPVTRMLENGKMGDGDEGGRRSREREGGKEVPVWKTVEEGRLGGQ